VGILADSVVFLPNLHFILVYALSVISQGTPSTVTSFLVTYGENPYPLIERYCPPVYPELGLISVMMGITV
jgi:hypothetical protein